MLVISRNVAIPEQEIEMNYVRAQGAGGQHVNKVSTAVHLRFDVAGSSLPEFYKTRLLALNDSRVTRQGVIVIKAQNHKSQEKNRQEALLRLKEMIQQAAIVRKRRQATKPTRASQKRRLDSKTKHGKTKLMRKRVSDDN